VLSFNAHGGTTHPFYRNTKEMIPGCTSSGEECPKRLGTHLRTALSINIRNMRVSGGAALRRSAFSCEHRVKKGRIAVLRGFLPGKRPRLRRSGRPEQRRSARSSRSTKPVQLKNNKGELLKAGEKGTKPNVFYVRSYKTRASKA